MKLVGSSFGEELTIVNIIVREGLVCTGSKEGSTRDTDGQLLESTQALPRKTVILDLCCL